MKAAASSKRDASFHEVPSLELAFADPDPSMFLNESDSMLIFAEASEKDPPPPVSRAGRAELVESIRTVEGIA